MRLLQLSGSDLANLAVANVQVENVILVPCWHEGMAGASVDYDDMMDPSDTFLVQRDALAGFDVANVFDYVVNISIEISIAVL